MVVIVGCGSYAVPQTVLIILYLAYFVNGYIIYSAYVYMLEFLSVLLIFLPGENPRLLGGFKSENLVSCIAKALVVLSAFAVGGKTQGLLTILVGFDRDQTFINLHSDGRSFARQHTLICCGI